MILCVKVTLEPTATGDYRQGRYGEVTPIVEPKPKAHALLWSKEETEERMHEAERWTAPGAEGETWTVLCMDDCDDLFEKARAWALAQLEPVEA